MKKIVLILLCIANWATAQNTDVLFADANTLYKEGKYKEAIELYQQIEENREVSSELYHNLGNAYYKLNKVGPSIYNYEKALKLDPLNEDAKNNLVYAKRLSLDRIEALPKSLLQKFNERILQKLTYNTWAVISIIFSFLSAILFLLFYFSYASSKKRLYFTTSILSFILLLITLAITINQYNYSINNIEAIIFSEEVSVKNEPTNTSDEIFMLHEGTKVKVLDTVDDWKKIKLADGKIGWILKNTLKEL